jgi:hypothetical protein
VAVIDPVVVRALALAAVDAEVGPGELPPHPATSTPLRSAAAVSTSARGRASLFV